jgi:hypothetical protein
MEKILWVDSCLFQDRPKRALRHVAGMIRYGRLATGLGIEPDFVAAGSLAVEFKAVNF